MFKTLVVLCLAFAAVQGQVRDIGAYGIVGERTDDFIKSNRKEFAQTIATIDHRLETFTESYNLRIENLNTQIPMTTATVEQMEEHLGPLELISDFSNNCVVKNRFLVPTVAATKTAMAACLVQASNQLPTLIKDAQNYRTSILNYINAYFEPEIKKCGTSFKTTTTNYTLCITTVTKTTRTNVNTYVKTFDSMMDTVDCNGKAQLKRAADCILAVIFHVNSQMAEASVSINNCIMGKDEPCKPCPAVCSETLELKVDYTNATMKNIFYGAKEHKDCLLLKLK